MDCGNIFETGDKDMKGSFKNDLQNGEWSYWYPNGTLYYKDNS